MGAKKGIVIPPVIDFGVNENPPVKNEEKHSKEKGVETSPKPAISIASPGVALSKDTAEHVKKEVKEKLKKEGRPKTKKDLAKEAYEAAFEKSFSKRKNSIPVSGLSNDLFLDAITCLNYGERAKGALYCEMVQHFVDMVKPQMKDFSALRHREYEKLRIKHRTKFDEDQKANGKK